MAVLLSVAVICLTVCLTFGASVPGVKTTEKYNQSTFLDEDENFILFWNFNDTHITFEVHVRAKGWVGFGLSENGNMYPGDVVVGWVSDQGQAHFTDRHTVGHRMPIQDKSQDWTLLHAEENEFGTVLKFVRRIETCDSTEDKIIPEGTVRLIYAYSHTDPTSDDSITYHGTTRGTKSVSLLSATAIPDNLPTDLKHFDFLNNNYLVPNDATTYWCRAFTLPAIGKHHMIKFEAIITPGNEMNVHHILMYRCKNGDSHSNGASGMCYGKRPAGLPNCGDVILGWAIGGQPFYFPEQVGFSVGAPDDNLYYVMETHFDNPHMKSGMIDNSGIRITLTNSLRPMEAGMFELGQIVNFLQMVPPYQDGFISKGFCNERCMREGLSQSNLTEIKMIAALQHSHLLGAGMKTRHFRNGVELKPLIEDPNYDFNFQEMRVLPKEVSVYPGDSFSVECTYDSRGRTLPTFGGLSTAEEMCLTFVFYYPKMKMNSCISQHMYDDFRNKVAFRQKMMARDWTNKTVVAEYVTKTEETVVYHHCGGEEFNRPPPLEIMAVEKETAHPYVPPPPVCT